MLDLRIGAHGPSLGGGAERNVGKTQPQIPDLPVGAAVGGAVDLSVAACDEAGLRIDKVHGGPDDRRTETLVEPSCAAIGGFDDGSRFADRPTGEAVYKIDCPEPIEGVGGLLLPSRLGEVQNGQTEHPKQGFYTLHRIFF
jgi:hypothetical protein